MTNLVRPTPYFDAYDVSTFVGNTGDPSAKDVADFLDQMATCARISGNRQVFVDSSDCTSFHFNIDQMCDHVTVTPVVMATLAKYLGPTFGLLF